MFYGRNNQTQGVNVNTNFYNSFSDTAQIIVGGWNQQLSIKVKPCVGKDANGVRQFAEDRSQILSTSITPDNALTLIEGFEKQVLPAIRGEKPSGSASIVMGNAESRKILTVGYENGNAYLSIATNLDNVGKAGSEIKHIFNKRSYLVDYIPEQGNANECFYEADLFNFMEKIKGAQNLIPMTAHSIKYNEASRAAYNGNNNGNANVNYQPRQPEATGYSAPMSSVDGFGDFTPFT